MKKYKIGDTVRIKHLRKDVIYHGVRAVPEMIKMASLPYQIANIRQDGLYQINGQWFSAEMIEGV